MADYEHVDLVLGDSLWDAEGREFTTKHTRWASAKQAGAMARRNDAVGLVEAPGQPISWMRGVELAQWWAHAKRHFDVPGTVDGKPDEQGRIWSAHVWRRGDERLLEFEQNC